MVKAIINICSSANQILNIVKAKEGFKDKSQAINHVVLHYGQKVLTESHSPAFLQRVKELENKSSVEIKETRF